MKKIRLALYGINGHQVHSLLESNPRVELVAAAAFPRENLSPGLQKAPGLKLYGSLDELLRDSRVDLVSLCSPRRRDQAADAVKCLQAGKHVYAEKPCAMTEGDLDLILKTVAATGRQFHEMAGSGFEQPYFAMGELVRQGVIGTVVQVFAQKSYPYHDARPQDEEIDGGLIGQNAIHAMRFVEHVAGVKAVSVQAIETGLGNPKPGQLRIASGLLLRLANGGVASIIANYLNPKAFGSWGNEHLRIFGTLGLVESVDGGRRTRLVLNDKDCGPLDTSQPGLDFFDCYLQALLGKKDRMPLSLEDELHPTRMVIRAKAAAERV